MKIDLENLRTTTQDAIQKGKKEAARALQEKEAKKAADNAKIVAEAEAIIATIPEKCREAAAKGLSHAMIYREREYEYFKTTRGTGTWNCTIIGGPGIRILEACREAGLKVEVRSEHDGIGVNDWAEIIVSWD